MFTEHKIPLAIAVGLLLAVSGCQKKTATPVAAQGATELGWAREALDRNPNIEVVAVDAAAGVFTIRSRNTGEMSAVPVGDLAAAPISQLKQPTAPPPPAVAAAAPPTAPPAPANEQIAAQMPEVSRAPEPTTAAAQPAGQQPQDPGYVIDRSGGQIKVSGPGVSIVSSGPASANAAAGGGNGTQAADPIICEGKRLLHLDGRTLYVDGDAVTAREGCELHITNSRIVGSGMGVVVRNATVHIANSYVEGATASFDADARAKVFVRNSTFQGLPRRDEFAHVQDQGGNRWR